MAGQNKYKVLRKIDAGGMAEVYEGMAESLEGFRKKVAIKRVLPHLAEDKNFINMFLDEARVSLNFSHANIVQVFDIGEAGNTYFIVMEYVKGTNLKKLIETFTKNHLLIPVEQAVYIIMEVCRGLSYAHQLEDAEGRRLNIVHRDISPPNILLSAQGEVKVLDFGLAKATNQLEHTAPGVVKGKFAYLAPEAAKSKPLDHRVDIFGCGIVLWEMLAGKRLFLGRNDIETIRNIREARVPDLMPLNPFVTEQLNAIVKRALTAEPSERYQDCDELAEALADFLFNSQLKVTSYDLKRTVSPLVDQKRRDETAQSIIDNFIQEELSVFASIDDRSANPVSVENGPAPSVSQIAPSNRSNSLSLETLLEGEDTTDPTDDSNRQILIISGIVAFSVIAVVLTAGWLLGLF